MKNITGIEGDYIETKNNNLFFDVKGLLHPNDRKVCFLRFYPHKNGDRIKKGKNFKKVYSLEERYSILREKYPQYLFFSSEFDIELQGAKIEDIKKIYTPREYYNELKTKKNLSKIEKHSKKLCDLFITKGNISENSIGISGSPMIGLSKEDSDIDIIIYGTQDSLEFQDKLKSIFQTSNSCRMYNLEEYKAHYKWRVGGSDISFGDFLKSEKRKLHQGKFHGIDFFIRYIKSPKDWNGTYYDYKFKNLGRIKIEAKIIDSTNSIFTPCSYKIKCLKVIERKINCRDIDLKILSEISSFRGRFCEQAINGENVLVNGKLEEVNCRNDKSYIRILLTDQVQDKMIISD